MTVQYPVALVPVLAGAVEAAGNIVAAKIDAGHFHANTQPKVFSDWVAAIASGIMTEVVPSGPYQ